MINTFFLIVVFILYAIAGFYFVWSMMFGVPFYPSSKSAIESIIKFLPADKSKRIVELGAGDGRLAFAIAKKGYKVVAIEYNPFLSLVIRFKKFFMRDKNVTVKNKNFFKEDLTQYDCYVGYLFPHSMEKLDKVIFCDQNKGKTVISNTFKLKLHEPIKVDGKIYYYVVD